MLGFPKNHQNNGFTLIEIIISILIISLVVIVVLTFFPVSKRATEESALKTRIANNVVSKIEELKGLGYRILEKLYEDSSDELLLELDVESGDTYLNGNLIDSTHSLYDNLYSTFKLDTWKTDLSNLGVSKGLIEISRIGENNSPDSPFIENLLRIRIRVEWGKDKSYEITTYISE